jgi:hypothetical protein
MTQTESRPAGNRTASLSDGRTAGSLDVNVAPDVGDPFVLGYQLGYSTGYELGYRRAENDMAAAWHELYLHLHRELAQPTSVELERRRKPTDDPCGRPRCRGCPRCVRASWVRWRVAHGLPRDWPGTVEPLRWHRS